MKNLFTHGGGGALNHSSQASFSTRHPERPTRYPEIVSVSQRRFAFTLAEVLVTLGIIGVVSAMTIPSLMNNYQRQTYVAQLHKVYNEMSQAVMQYKTDRNALTIREAGLTSQAAIDNWVKSYYKVVQDCGTDGTGCFAVGQYKKMNGNSISLFESDSFMHYVLANGASIAFISEGLGIQVNIDVNGKKGPNVVGRDTFAFRIYNDGTIDDDGANNGQAPLTREQRELSYTTHCNGAGNSWWGCFGKILNDGWQMTY